MTKTRWLDDQEQLAWRGWLALNAELPALLNRQLQRDSDLSLQDFDVLVRLTDGGSGRLRVSELATALAWERSRLSHHVKRMAARGLVVREECEDDGRGAFVVLTDEGRAAIEAAAPDHVTVVRRLVFDALTRREVAALGRITDKLLSRLAEEQQPAGT
jgi:DNA-binding MarR family transcriptional regulator